MAYRKHLYRDTITSGKTRRNYGTIREESKELLIEGQLLAPSIVAKKGEKWFFGEMAAKMAPGEGLKVYHNWKSNLWLKNNAKKREFAGKIAVEFFRWLRKQVTVHEINLKTTQTRVAIPALEHSAEVARKIAEYMNFAGWAAPEMILKVSEPYANLVGLMTEGHNAVLKNKYDEYNLHLGEMYEGTFWKLHARNIIFNSKTNSEQTVLVLDVGSFTTDAAILTFNVTDIDGESADGLQNIEEISFPVGVINQLDKPVFSALTKSHGINFEQLSFLEQEDIKKAVYQGTSIAIESSIINSTSQDKIMLENKVSFFAQSILKYIEDLIRLHNPSAVFLSGGGSQIPVLSKYFKHHFNQKRIEVVHPDFKSDRTNKFKYVEKVSLARLATALGGCSVILQGSAKTIISGNRPSLLSGQQKSVAADLPETPCRCNGGNKDCAFCDGKGYIVIEDRTPPASADQLDKSTGRILDVDKCEDEVTIPIAIFLHVNGESKGPYEKERIKWLLKEGFIDGKDLAWHEGLKTWVHVLDLLMPRD
tara:strand:+ start:3126 stop:4730 length:1605 start_codon:yes stop_codon:yes gene_type:complete